MRYLSPTSLHLWEADRERFFFRYLADSRQYDDQTNAMSVGSSFDAFVKAALHKHLFLKVDPQYEFAALFEAQVDSNIRDFALAAGQEVFDAYVSSGAYGDLLRELEAATEPPQFEFTLREEIEGVPLIGKPDCKYIRKGGVTVVLDWKVNGYCGKNATSPAKYYAIARDAWDLTKAKPSRTHMKPHKGYEEINFKGMKIGKHFLQDTDKKWADQLAIYSWMMGEQVGSENVVTCIDQIVTKPNGGDRLIRVASHRCRISREWQEELIRRLKSAWSAIEGEHIFPDLTPEESKDRCEILNFRNGVKGDDFWSDLTERKLQW